jgi:type I restriction enzyme S subunit
MFNERYLYYFLQTPEFTDLFKTSISGIIGGVGINKIRALHVPVPPLEEQEIIANQLDYLDSLIEKLRIQNIMDDQLDIRFKEELQKSILLVSIKGDLFSEIQQENLAKIEFDKYCHSKNIFKSVSHIYKDENYRLIEKIGSRHNDITEELPFEIPEDWIFIRLGDVIKLISGRDLTKDRYNSKQVGIPYMTGASNFDNGRLIINRWTNAPGVISQKGDLLITVKGTIGDIAYNYLGDIHIARQIMALRSDFLDYEYLKMVLSYYVTDLKSKARSLIPGISRENILNILFPLPPKFKQEVIVQKYKHMISLMNRNVKQ